MFRPRFRMLRTSLVVCMIFGLPGGDAGRAGPHHWGPAEAPLSSSRGRIVAGRVLLRCGNRRGRGMKLLSPPRDAVVVEVRGGALLSVRRILLPAALARRPLGLRPGRSTAGRRSPTRSRHCDPTALPVIVQGTGRITAVRRRPYQGNTTASNPPVTAQTPKAPEVIPTPAASKPLSSSFHASGRRFGRPPTPFGRNQRPHRHHRLLRRRRRLLSAGPRRRPNPLRGGRRSDAKRGGRERADSRPMLDFQTPLVVGSVSVLNGTTAAHQMPEPTPYREETAHVKRVDHETSFGYSAVEPRTPRAHLSGYLSDCCLWRCPFSAHATPLDDYVRRARSAYVQHYRHAIRHRLQPRTPSR